MRVAVNPGPKPPRYALKMMESRKNITRGVPPISAVNFRFTCRAPSVDSTAKA